MTRNAAFYTDRALDGFNAGFSSKASKQAALGDLSNAFSYISGEISKILLADRTIEGWDDLYWGIPALHNWREKHTAIYIASFPQQVAEIEKLVAMRDAIKVAAIAPPAKREPSPYEVKARETIEALIERRQTQYANAIRLGEVFHGLPVSANSHWVINEHGTRFLRTFWYLAGELTPLQVIIAAAEELARKEEEIA